MTYKETVEYLFNATPVFEKIGAGAYKEGLQNTLALDSHFGHPHRRFKSIHVAGTNGKGSVSHSLAAILQSAGYKVGLYTSPHLVDFRERIRVNGECISEEYVVDFVEKERSFFEPLCPSFFELTTAMAFKYFAEQEVDFAVIEVGLGGRLDCTNIITPILSVITNISFDHTGFLGNTLAQIAGEKAGIIKRGVPVVIGEYTSETRPVFEAKAKEMKSPIIFAQDEEELGAEIDFELKGEYQKKNKQTILVATREIEDRFSRMSRISRISSFSRDTIAEALQNVCALTGLRGRWEKIGEKPLVICDTGHNVGGWEYLAPQIAAQECRQRRIVFGMVDDKDVNTVMAMLPKDAVYYWAQASTHRAIPVDKIEQLGSEAGLCGTSYMSVEAAYNKALADSTPEDFIFVGGSSYVVADLFSSFVNSLS